MLAEQRFEIILQELEEHRANILELETQLNRRRECPGCVS